MFILVDTVNVNIIFKLWNKQMTLASCILWYGFSKYYFLYWKCLEHQTFHLFYR